MEWSTAAVSLLVTMTFSNNFFQPGGVWLDTRSEPIQAHGGGVIYHEGTYYWYGEDRHPKRTGKFHGRAAGISCYSSKDLYNWKYEGMALARVTDDDEHDLAPNMVLERPKVIYNAKTKKFVMWTHIDCGGYKKASAGVAVSSAPAGPFKYLWSVRPMDTDSRDQTVFKDDDGTAYHIHSSYWNKTMRIEKLTDDYLKPSGEGIETLANLSREAPAVFKHGGKYYMITSGCSGWDANAAGWAVADSMLGEWTQMGNPCLGENSDKTFYSQSTFVLPVAEGVYIYMGDRWKRKDLTDSRYIWLPLRFEDGKPVIKWIEKWEL